MIRDLFKDKKNIKRLDAKKYSVFKHEEVLRVYERLFTPLAEKPIKLLELGVLSGRSLLLWRDFFIKGTIVGLDREKVQIKDSTGRIRVYQGLQQDTRLLDKIAKEVAPEGFDIIIDDASHIAELTRISFWHLFNNHLKNGGVFIIEDWCTGYMSKWPDGKKYNGINHLAGMVGFIKELIDKGMRREVNELKFKITSNSVFDSILIYFGQVVIKKKQK
ncbi:hypothetical protein HZA33_04090 [Candidatus Pacearchaeota archaeon]|nr:hypothetical protein [Candidatus Pacearchaeota archaeon]